MTENPAVPMDPAERRRLTRRNILKASAAAGAALGAAGLPVLSTSTPAIGTRNLHADALVPAKRRGIILYTVRDRISAAPDDSGVPYGFERVLARVAEQGYKEVEFAGYTQHTSILGRQITPREIRKILDDNGLVANGTHTSINPSTFTAELDIAETLGMDHIGTGSDPTGSNYTSDWDAAADVWNELGRQARKRRIKLYTHNHAEAYSFLLDEGPRDANGQPTRSSGMRRLEYFFGKADPKYVFFELDIYWAYVARFRFQKFTDKRGRERTDLFDPILNVASRGDRFPLFHAKDGDRNAALRDGHEMVPLGEGDINFQQFFETIGDADYRHANYEQDNAPGGAGNPGQSLDFAALSYQNMSDLTIYKKGR